MLAQQTITHYQIFSIQRSRMGYAWDFFDVMSGIGLINEKPLHASLKQWYARPGDRFEVPVDRFVVDIVRDNLLIEIQTRNFASINAKLSELTRSYEVRLVYPVVQEKWIVRCDGVRRKSPKRGQLEDLFGNW